MQSLKTNPAYRGCQPPASQHLANLVAHLRARLAAQRKVYRQQMELRRLSDALLDDIGLTRAGAERMASHPDWRRAAGQGSQHPDQVQPECPVIAGSAPCCG